MKRGGPARRCALARCYVLACRDAPSGATFLSSARERPIWSSAIVDCFFELLLGSSSVVTSKISSDY